MPASGVAVASGLIGAGLLWSALTNQKLLTTVKNVISGKKPGQGPANTGVTQGNVLNSVAIPGVTVGIPAGVAAGSNTGNQVLGQVMATAYGWGTGQNWAYLRTGWQEESGWQVNAANDPSDPYNHAYGIPQANPGTKMATAGADWKTSAATQIKWGLNYIKETYGAPVNVPGWSANGPAAGYVGY